MNLCNHELLRVFRLIVIVILTLSVTIQILYHMLLDCDRKDRMRSRASGVH